MPPSMPSVGRSARWAKSYAVMTDLVSFTRMPVHVQNLATTSSSFCIPAGVAVLRVRSSAKPRPEVRRPLTVLKPTPDWRKPIRRALNTRLKSTGRQDVALLGAPSEKHRRRPAIWHVCLIVCSFIQIAQQIYVRDIQLGQPAPNCCTVDRVECVLEINIYLILLVWMSQSQFHKYNQNVCALYIVLLSF